MGDSDRRGAPPVRACAGCRTRRPVTELIRVARQAEEVLPDLRRRIPGRGMHLCADPACFEAARKRRAFGRTLRHPVNVDLAALLEATREALVAALVALLTDGRRSGAVVPSRGPVLEALPVGSVPPELLRATIVDPRHAARAAWLAGALSRFTFDGPGAMKRRLARGGTPIGPHRARKRCSDCE